MSYSSILQAPASQLFKETAMTFEKRHSATLFHAFLAIFAVMMVSIHTSLAKDNGWPRTITHAAGELTLKAKPLRIVSTTPSVTGILLAINAPLVASTATTPSNMTDNKGFFSQWAEVADQHGVEILYTNLEFDIEAIIGWEPDLVVASATGADSVIQHYAALKEQNIPTIVVNYSNHSWQELATQLGVATGLEQEAAVTIARFNTLAADAANTISAPKEPVNIVGYNLGGSYSIANPSSPHAQLLTALGFKIAELPKALETDVKRTSDFAFISHENLSAAITGNAIFLMRGTDNDVQTLLADSVLANLPSVVMKHVYPLGPSSFRIDYYSGLQLINTVAKQFPKK